MNIILFIICGVVGGVLGGMGMGGGTLLIPLLTLILNVNQQNAQAINLIAFLPMSIFALIIHFKNGLVLYKTALPIAITGVITSIASSFLASSINSQNLSVWFGIFLIIIGIFDIYSIWLFNDFNKKDKNIKDKNANKSFNFKYKVNNKNNNR